MRTNAAATTVTTARRRRHFAFEGNVMGGPLRGNGNATPCEWLFLEKNGFGETQFGRRRENLQGGGSFAGSGSLANWLAKIPSGVKIGYS